MKIVANRNKTNLIIRETLKKDWILILAFTTVTILAVVGLFFWLFGFSGTENNLPVNEQYTRKIISNDATTNQTDWEIIHTFGINDLVYFLLSGPGICFILICFLTMFNVHFVDEKKSGKCSLWWTMAVSRKKLFITKMFIFYIEMVIIYLPIILFIFFIGYKYNNISDDFVKNVLLQIVGFLAFLFFATSFYTWIYLCLVNHVFIAHIITFSVLAIHTGLFLADKFYLYTLVDYRDNFFAYTNVFNFISNQFELRPTGTDGAAASDDGLSLYLKLYATDNYMYLYIFTPIVFAVGMLFQTLSVVKFNNLDFNI